MSEGVNIAYQVVGTGPFDLVYVPGWVSNVEMMWEEPRMATFLERLASFARLIVFDKRGTGLSDPVPDTELPGLERRMDDVRAVMDAAGSGRAALLGHSEGGNMCILFAATFPARTSAMVLVGCYAKQVLSDPRRYDIPVTVISCEFPTAMLREWLSKEHAYVAELGKVKDFELVDLPTGHWPQLTRPRELAAAILTAVDR